MREVRDMRRALRWLRATTHAMVCDVLTFLFKTCPRVYREWRAFQECDFKLAERLRRREYDWRHNYD